MKVGICTGGGDCPGLNAIIRAAVKHGILNYNMELWGIKDSFNGLMTKPYNVWQLNIESVTEILNKGGTILGTTNEGNPFSLKNQSKKGPTDKSQLVVDAYNKLKFDCIIVIGGDGTQGIAYKLSEMGINIIGIPKTIDNDLAATFQTVGFETAVGVATDAVERLKSTAESHHRIMVLEVMGRNSGHIAVHAGIAGGANVILIPEIPFNYDTIIQKIKERQSLGRNFSVVVVAEGAYESGSDAQYHTTASGKKNLGGIGGIVAKELHQRTSIDTRVTVLGHIQRGGAPSPGDRILGTAYGVRAIELVHRKDYGKIVSWQGNEISEIDYTQVAGKFRPVDLDDIFLKSAQSIGVSFG